MAPSQLSKLYFALIDDDDINYSDSITHNIKVMAGHADLYWHFYTNPPKLGKDFIVPLSNGLALLLKNPESFIRFEFPKGYGSYDEFVDFVEACLEACIRYPDSRVTILKYN